MTTSFIQIGKKITAGTLLVMMAVSSFGMFPRQAEATLPVADVANAGFHVITSLEQTISTVLEGEGFLKEYTLDGIATGIAKSMLRSIIVSTLNWVSNGFEGSPAFVRDLNATLLQVGDTVVSHFTNQLLNGVINTPFGNRIAQGVIASYYLYTSRDRLASQLEYTLDRFSENPSAFLYGDFSQGGWNAWYAANANCGNNPYCAQFAAHDDLVSQVQGEIDQRVQEISWGNGFLSWRGDCVIANQGGEVVKDAEGVELSSEDECLQQEINTPGSVIHDQISESLGSDIAQLVSADELNEAIAGLLNSLVSKAINGSGLAGGSGSTSSGLRPGEAPNVAGGFTQTLETQRQKVDQYGGAWAKIKNAAEGAKSQLEACISRSGNREVLENEVEPALERATAAVTKAAAAAAALDELKTRAEQSAQNANVGFEQIIADYQELQSTGTLPSANDIVDSVRESQNQDSLYARMQEIEDDACRIRGL